MRTRTKTTTLMVALFCLATAGAAQAQDRKAVVDINRFRAAPDSSAGFAVGDPRGLALGQFALSLTLDEAIRPLVLRRADGTSEVLVPSRLGGVLTGLVGLYGPLSVVLDIPFVPFQAGTLSALPPSAQPAAGGALGAVAVGDIRLAPRLSLLSEGKHPVDLALDLSLTLPTGSTTALSGDDGLGGSATATVARRLLPALRVFGQFGVRFRPSRQVLRMPVGNELVVRAAAVYRLPPKSGVDVIIAEIDSGVLLTDPTSATNPAEWRVGARYCLRDGIALGGGIGSGITKAYGTPLARVTLSAGYDPRACQPEGKDSDGDGVLDAADKCPESAGAVANDGCPAAQSGDTDMDGVPDEADTCPQQPGPVESHGCPPPPADADNDGVADDADACPQKAGVAEHKGCPVPDKDRDGVNDADDQCPDEPGQPDRRGCPIYDFDGDALEDADDRCPAEKGGRDHFGCPVKDDDADGVSFEVDVCPAEKGLPANAGCKAPQQVAIRASRLELLAKVAYKGQTAAIDPASLKLLDQVAAALVAHPELGRIRVEDHLDDELPADASKMLTQQRADGVKAYLVSKGVAADRLDAVGRGMEAPLGPNLSPKARANNRRIELAIIPRGAYKPAAVAAPVALDEMPLPEGLGEVKPAEVKPAEVKPAEVKPAEVKPVDGDGDGVNDDVDNCPTVKGTAANAGCKVPQVVAIKADRLEFVGKILFGAGGVGASAKPILDQVAAVIVAHPEFGGVRVESHTDNTAPAESAKVTAERANFVKAYLVEKGVPAARIDAVGMGDSSPVAPNDTPENKSLNRRILFLFKRGEAAPAPAAAPAAKPEEKKAEAPAVKPEEKKAEAPSDDTDGDGVANGVDNCPTVKGTAANQGCKVAQVVAIKPPAIEITGKILFGATGVGPSGKPILDQVAAVMAAHPEFGVVRIESHTDDSTPGEAVKVTTERANFVKVYLQEKGVPAERLEAVGMGDTKPAAPNDTPANKALNRRILFFVAKDAPLSGPKPEDKKAEAPAPKGDEKKPAAAAPAAPKVEEKKPAAPAAPAAPAPKVEEKQPDLLPMDGLDLPDLPMPE